MECSDFSGIMPIPLAVNLIPPDVYIGDSINDGRGDAISGTSMTRVEGSWNLSRWRFFLQDMSWKGERAKAPLRNVANTSRILRGTWIPSCSFQLMQVCLNYSSHAKSLSSAMNIIVHQIPRSVCACSVHEKCFFRIFSEHRKLKTFNSYFGPKKVGNRKRT